MLPGSPAETIRHINGYSESACTYIPVVIIGAGAGGIATGCQLKEKLGFDQFRIFDRHGGIGGTWWINRYPGVGCDISAVLYSFSFAPNPNWSSFFPPGEEIQQYFSDVCTKYEIGDKFQFNVEVDECRWLDEEQLWEIKISHLVPGIGDKSARHRQKLWEEHGERAIIVHRETIRTKVICSAVGGMGEPQIWPEHIPGIERFQGPIFHSARWEEHDMKDKNIIVLGTGCSAAQLVPKLTQAPYHAKSVTQLMRSPPWVVPETVPARENVKLNNHLLKAARNVPFFLWLLRQAVAAGNEYDFRLFGSNTWAQKERLRTESHLRDAIKKSTPEKYHDMLTPKYSVGCKRRVFGGNWFEGLRDPKINLTTQPLTEVRERTVVIGPGRTYPDPADRSSAAPSDRQELSADMIITANGFRVLHWAHPLRIYGRHGHNLIDVMNARGGPQAYQGTAMDGFPNLFITIGPNTANGHTSILIAIENQVQYSLKFISQILAGDATLVEVKKSAEMAYTQRIQAALKDMIWTRGGCTSFYFMENGWNPTVYPWSQMHFTYRCMFPVWSDWDISYTTKGLWKRRVGGVAKLVVLTALMVAAVNVVTKPQVWNVQHGIMLAQSGLRSILQRGIGALGMVQAQLN
ncbi:hypothetical protein CFE70_000719 [Pyrenophora teres f. teres 0-1]|uniref:L-ornithine N(5)-monooxygenase [NAD(P)H] n=1 Tax=Pyrenophora teres f. teres (strain 0-1) TaxID=861557 RepID=E3RIM2_PYRTT|nr:hypothetical protein PTT_07895 [Pyrenophora teres f. teres 0-1]KAE8836013.1 hypothetical protein HRS9139_04111 [Pyrenophora teres f. teres]KAE8839565.1 hypothetical protein HRS9122_06170 [Pyrenophora teres f. teres]KAE8862837.1 hypothetical protein PTNB29_05399 [Pyrenophora teres f. teres]